jgi:hypothetical protein
VGRFSGLGGIMNYESPFLSDLASYANVDVALVGAFVPSSLDH